MAVANEFQAVSADLPASPTRSEGAAADDGPCNQNASTETSDREQQLGLVKALYNQGEAKAANGHNTK